MTTQRGFAQKPEKKPLTAGQQIVKILRKLRREDSEGVLSEVTRLKKAAEEQSDNSRSDTHSGTTTSVYVTTRSTGINEAKALRDGNQRRDWGQVCNVSSGRGIIEEFHHREWLESCVCEDIINLNVKSLEGQTPLSYLLYSDKLTRTNTGRVSLGTLDRYAHCEHGGWYCGGVDVLTGDISEWGTFKPDNPHFDISKGKYVKYEHPLKVPTEIFALRIPVNIWEVIARRYDVALPDNYRDVVNSPGIFWKWVIDNPKVPLIVTEGAKKAAAILSCSYVAIALPGITMGIRRPKNDDGEVIGMPYLIPQLQIFASPERRIYFCFDQDSKRSTRRDVNNAIGKTAKLFKKFGCQPKVISWDRKIGKGIDDALYNSSLLGIEPEEQFGNFYRSASGFDDWESKQLKELTYPVAQKLNRRYLLNQDDPNDTLPPTDAQLIGVRSPKGTGKTHWMAWFTAPLLSSGEKRILLLTHRIQLSTQTADRLGIPYVTEVKDCVAKNLFGMGLCIDSLHPNSQARFKPEYWGKSVVIIDEVMQVIWHLLSSTTCVKERVAIIKTLKELLQNVIRSGGKIILADADLNDIAIDFIKGLIGWEIKTHIIENEYKFNQPWKVHNFKDKDARRLVTLLKEKLNKGEKHLLCVSGQKAKSRWGSIALEAFFKKHIPNLKILRIDSETVANPKHPAYGCVNKINVVIKNFDLVIATPTIETGVSIEEKHFDGVWGIFQGVSTTDSVRQFLSRYRLPVPRYIWVKSTGIGFIGNKSTNHKALIASQRKLDKANRNRLIDCGFEETLDGNFEPITLTTWAKLAAIINQGKWNYSEQVLHELEAEGHIIIDIDNSDEFIDSDDSEKIELPSENQAEKTKLEIDNNRDEQYQKYRENVAQAESLNDTAYEKLQKQQSRNDDELLQLRKGRLERTYGIEVKPNLVQKDDDGWYPQIRLHYYFDVGRKFLKARDESIINSALSNGNGEYFIPDTNKSLLGKKIDALEFLGINRLYNDTNFDKNHPVIQDIYNKCRNNIYALKLALGVDFSTVDNPIECTQRLLNLIGHKMPCLGRFGTRRNRVRKYGSPHAGFVRDEKTNKIILVDGQAIPLPDGREEVFSAWIERDTQAEQKALEQKRKLSEQKALEQRRQLEKQKAASDDEWLQEDTLKDICETLKTCDSSELLDLRQIFPDYALKAAAKLLPADIRAKIAGWVKQQNRVAAIAC